MCGSFGCCCLASVSDDATEDDVEADDVDEAEEVADEEDLESSLPQPAVNTIIAAIVAAHNPVRTFLRNFIILSPFLLQAAQEFALLCRKLFFCQDAILIERPQLLDRIDDFIMASSRPLCYLSRCRSWIRY